MRPFQFLPRASQFWSTSEMAGPTTWDVLRFWDTPRPLRPVGRTRPPPFGPWSEPEPVRAEAATALATFWSHHYNGTDWVFRPDPQWVAEQLTDSNTCTLVVREDGIIVGSIVCRGLVGRDMKGASFRLGTLELPQAYIIEGLCIHPRWRGRHLAGWLIAWIDHLMNAAAPQAFFWSREAPPRDMTYVASHTYAYLEIGQKSVRTDRNIVAVPWDEFRRIWASYVPRWDRLDTAAFPTCLPADPLRVWRCEALYVAVSDTRRWTRDGRHIWEVQFCGDLYDPLGLACGSPREGERGERGEEGRDVLEAVGAALGAEGPGLLFVSSAPWQGGCTTWPRPWVVGTAGHHTTYIYNYMPPVFHRLATLFLRNEL
jgi:hypothetical protein